jgi:hypothetical protein
VHPLVGLEAALAQDADRVDDAIDAAQDALPAGGRGEPVQVRFAALAGEGGIGEAPPAVAGRREPMTTSCPRSSSAAATCLPTKPAPPRMRTFMCQSFLKILL